MLKAMAVLRALVFVVLVARPVLADTLITGAIRDRAGSAVTGARVTAFDGAGHIVGTDVSFEDGTFAVAAQAAPAAISIACNYCRTIRRPVDPSQPVVVIVDRYSAITARGPTSADMRALPYRSAADIAALQPFTVVDSGRITDRNLDRDGAVLIDGLPFYRPVDGSDLSQLVPAHSIAALDVGSPLSAPIYGGYSEAGIFDVRLSDPDLTTSRIDLGDASDIVARGDARSGGAGYAASSDAGENRQLAQADVNVPFAGGRLAFNTLGMSDSELHAFGAGLSYATDSRRFTTAGTLSATQSNDSSLLALSARVHSRGALGLELGVRAQRASSSLDGLNATQFDAAVYAQAARHTATSNLSATIAFDRGSDAGIEGVSQSGALVASLSDDVRLGTHWTAHAGAVSNLRIPTFGELAANAPLVIAGDRSLLFEQSLTYGDLSRLQASVLTYTQRTTGSALQRMNGVGVDTAWQIVPELSLRTWLLRSNTAVTPAEYAFAPQDLGVLVPATAPLSRGLIWLSYEHTVRVDALLRGGALEGDVRIPVTTSFAFAIGTAQYRGRRVTTFGLTRR